MRVEFDPPGPRMREYVQAVKAIFESFRGGKLDFDGTYHELSLMPQMWSPGPIEHPDPPVDIAAVGPWMVQMAGAAIAIEVEHGAAVLEQLEAQEGIHAVVINAGNAIQRVHGRTKQAVESVSQAGPRYMLGARYKF